MVEDTPDDLVFELHNEVMWGAHPYGYSILGTRETVAALGVAELRELHQRAYHPPQLVVAAAGHVEHDRLLDALERTGWAKADRGVADPLTAPTPLAARPEYRHFDRDAAQTHVVFGAPTVRYADPRRYAVTLVSMLLGGGMSSRLFQRVREELGLAYSISTFQNFHVDTGVHGVYVATAPETAAQAVDAIRAELASVAGTGIPDDELTMAKGQLKGQVTLSLEGVSSRMYRAAAVELYGQPFRPLDEVLAAIDAISAEEVAAVCREFFDPAAQTVVSLGPQPIT